LTNYIRGIHAFFGGFLAWISPVLSPTYLRASAVRFGFYFRFRAAAIDSFNAAATSASWVITWAGFGMCDSRPSHALTASRSATADRPSRRTGIPSLAQRCAVATGMPRYRAMAVQPLSSPPTVGCDRSLGSFCFTRIAYAGSRSSNRWPIGSWRLFST
jgi:hypothetical protein